MGKIFAIILLLLYSISSTAQNTLMGWVTEQNSGKKPVGGVSIKSSGSSNPISSSAKGEFTLTFQGLDVGETVILRPEKVGWELVNEKEMQVNLPSQPTENKVKVVLCKAGTLALAKQAYYKIADPYIIQQYNKKLAALDKEKSSYQVEKAKLQEERNRLQNQLAEYAEEFIRVNLDDASDIERRAIALFKEGRIDESIQLRESLKSGKEIKKAVKDKAKADSIIALHTRNLKNLAKEYIFKFDFKSAEEKYEELVSADTSNFDNLYDWATFSYDQNKHNEAVKHFVKALLLAKTDYAKARVYNNIGLLYLDMNNQELSLKYLLNSFEIRERLSSFQYNSEVYKSDVAGSLNNLALFYKKKGDYDSAAKYFRKSLVLYEQLAKNNPDKYLTFVAIALNGLGTIYYYTREDSLALDSYLTSLEIYESLRSANNDETKQAGIALVYGNLGSLYRANINNYVASSNALVKSLKIFEFLAQNNPDKYEPDVARIQLNLGKLYKYLDDIPKSIFAYTKALLLYEKLAEINSNIYEPFEAETLLYLGIVHLESGDYSKSSIMIAKSSEIYESLAKIWPDQFQYNQAYFLYELGFAYEKVGSSFLACDAFYKSSEIFEQLVKTQSNNSYDAMLATALDHLGFSYCVTNQHVSAIRSYQGALQIYGDLVKKGFQEYEYNIAQNLCNQSLVYQIKGDSISAINAYLKAIEIYERLARSNLTYEPLLAKTRYDLGFLYQKKGDFTSAFKIYQEALSICERLTKSSNPYEYDNALANILNGLGDVYVVRGNTSKALEVYQRALVIYKYLDNINPAFYVGPYSLSEIILNLEKYFSGKK